MVEYNGNSNDLDLIFHALADSTRRGLLSQLTGGDHRVTDLASHYEMSLNAISKHLKVLEKAELIQRNIQGRVHLCKINADRLKEIEKWMGPYKEYWERSLNNLEEYLTSSKGESDV